nr:MAG TPA: hypothetical protein [Caudoviricetes sp.]
MFQVLPNVSYFVYLCRKFLKYDTKIYGNVLR